MFSIHLFLTPQLIRVNPSDNISDGMKTREETTLANVVMNAFWFPEEYRPTVEFPEEPTPGKLAREYVTFS